MAASVILTRARAQSCRFETALRDRFGAGIPILIAPLLEIAPIEPLPALGRGDIAVFTSENGVAAFRRLGGAAGMRAYCVGPRTLAAAQAAGLNAEAGPGDAAGLARLISAVAPQARLVHLHGRHVTGDLAAALRAAGLRAASAAIYDQRAVPFAAAARAVLAGNGRVLLPVFSARTARLLGPELWGARAEVGIAAISPAVASELPVQAATNVEIAAQPDGDGMLDALGRLGVGEFS